jgi:alkylation response protein AidB-like acyl-CoA dehydrogenase
VIETTVYAPDRRGGGAEEAALRAEVREFLRDALPPDHQPVLGMASAYDPAFSEKLAARGWVGMSLPTEYGGGDRGAVYRWIVTEELLAAGAPMWAHWLADRQVGPLIAKFGSESMRSRLLPDIAAGRCMISAGMSEPDSGSDLASVRTAATEVEGGFSVSGTKVWTSGAQYARYLVTLCRTDPSGGDRHVGLSQLIVDLQGPGVTVSPIRQLDGEHHFNQVTLDEAFVPADMLIGTRGQGWAQVTSELVSERGGPDRYMSVLQLLHLALRHVPELLAGRAAEFGELMARFSVLRRMSYSIAATIDAGGDPGPVVPMVKDLGTTFEQEAVEFLRDTVTTPLRADRFGTAFEKLLSEAVVNAPTFTLRGGTNEVLRNLVARRLT